MAQFDFCVVESLFHFTLGYAVKGGAQENGHPG